MRRMAARILKAVMAAALVASLTLSLAANAAADSYTFEVNPKVGAVSETTMIWNDSYLDGPTTVYNAALAKFCMDAASADRDDTEETGREAICKSRMAEIKSIFEGVGFTVVRQDENLYCKSRGNASHITAYTVAKREARANGKDVTVYLVAIHPNGVGEVMSDFDFAAPVSGGEKEYDTTLAYPFTKTADMVNTALDSLVGDDENVRFVIAGESRGGGAANYLAKLLTDRYGPHRVQAYTYSTPNTAVIDEADKNSSYYNNIFNIVNPEDAVPYVPVEEWGFTKYGRTLQIDAETLMYDNDVDIEELYEAYSGKPFYSYDDNGEAVRELVEYLHSLAPTVEDYYTKKYKAYDEYKFVSSGLFGGSAVKTGNTAELSIFGFIQYIFGLSELFENIDLSDANGAAGQILVLRAQIKSIEDNKNNVFNPVLTAVLEHAFGCSSVDGLLDKLGIDASSYSGLLRSVLGLVGKYGTDFDAMFADIGDSIPQREGVAAHILYGYRAYIESEDDVDALYLNADMITQGETDSLESADGEAQLSGQRAFYDDMKLSSVLSEGSTADEIYTDYALSLSVKTSRADATPLEPNGPVSVSLKLSDTFKTLESLTLTKVETGEEIDFEIVDGCAVFETDTLGTFRIAGAKPQTDIISAVNGGDQVTVKVLVNESAENRMILAGYTGDGKMTGLKTWISAAGKSGTVTFDSFLPTTAYFKLFITTKDYSEPLDEAKTFPVSIKQ